MYENKYKRELDRLYNDSTLIEESSGVMEFYNGKRIAVKVEYGITISKVGLPCYINSNPLEGAMETYATERIFTVSMEQIKEYNNKAKEDGTDTFFRSLLKTNREDIVFEYETTDKAFEDVEYLFYKNYYYDKTRKMFYIL